jgi:multiple sugar transport system substrate-binding protein
MKSYRHLLLAITCAAILALALAVSGQKVTVELSHWSGTPQREFPHIEVQYQVPGGTIPDRDVILTRMAGGIAPDMVGISSRLMESLLPTGVLLSLDGYMERDRFDLNRFPAGAFINSTYRGRICGVPYTNSPYADYGLVYNREHLDRAGLAYPVKGWTYDDFAKTAKRLTVDYSGDGIPDQWGIVRTTGRV